MKFRSAYDDRSKEDFSLVCPEEVMTKQSEASACDVNKIVERWKKSGGAVDLSVRVGQFLDVSDIPDFQGANNFIVGANNLFMSLPAEIRYKFGNDAAAFLEFATNPANSKEMIQMGLAKPVEAPAGLPQSPIAGAATEGGEAAQSATETPSKGV